MTHLLSFLAQYNLHIFIPLVIMCWYLHKFDKKMTITSAAVQRLDTIVEKHEERIDDHEERIIKAETHICFLDKAKV